MRSSPCEQDVQSHSSVEVSAFPRAGAEVMPSYHSIHAEWVQASWMLGKTRLSPVLVAAKRQLAMAKGGQEGRVLASL